MGWGNESLFKQSWSHDQDGRHAHIWKKPLKNILLLNQKADDLKLGIQHWVFKCYQVCSNDDPTFERELFYGKVKFGHLCFCMGKG